MKKKKKKKIEKKCEKNLTIKREKLIFRLVTYD